MKNIFNEHLGIRIPNTIGDELKQYSAKEMLSVSDIVRRGIIYELTVLREKYRSNWNVK